MSTKAMYDLRESLCADLDQYARKGSLTKNDLETVNLVTDTIKNLDKINMMEETGSSYGEGEWNANGSYSNGMGMGGRYSGRRGNSRDGGNGYSGRNRMNHNGDDDMDYMESRMRREMGNY